MFPNAPWDKIVLLHKNLKSLILVSEEFDPKYNDFLQPSLEQKHALDHLIRAIAAETNQSEHTGDNRYIEEQYDHLIGHLYRAYFDAADWLSITIRDKITTTLKPYSVNCIKAAIPEYYSEYKPKLNQAVTEISALRGAKDVGKEKIIDEVNQYRELLLELLNIYNDIEVKLPVLDEHKKKEFWFTFKNWIFAVAGIIIGGLIVSLFK